MATKALKKSGSLYDDFAAQSSAAEDYQKKAKDDPYCSWDEKEALLLNRPKDAISNQSKSQIFDPRASTIVIERMNRVMAQNATGTVRSTNNPQDKLVSKIMNLTIQNYIIPNANSQFDMLTKFKLMDLYSLVYGSFPALVDYKISDSYIGPDLWLVPLRHFLPEANSTSIDDSNHAFIDTWVTRQWLTKRNEQTWKNINKVLEELDEKGSDKDTDQQSLAERDNRISYSGKGKNQLIKLRTRYEHDRWVTVAIETAGLHENAIVRDIPNPQKNDEIPIVMKHAFPLLDRFYGLGEFERSKTLQYAINSLWNLYLDGVKMRVYPPFIYNPNGVDPNSLVYAPAEKWIEIVPNSIRQFQTGSQSEQAFQSTFSTLVASILNQAGTTNTTTSDVTDPGMGRTPEALKMLGARESSRDAWDRFMMEKTIDKTMNLMVDMLATKQEKPIDLELFKEDITQLQNEFPNQADGALSQLQAFETGGGKLRVPKETWENTKFKYSVEPGTTQKKDQQEEHAALTEVMGFLMKLPGAMEQAAQTGVVRIGSSVIKLDELVSRFIITSGIQDPEKIVVDEDGQNEANGNIDPQTSQAMDQLGMMIQQMQPGAGVVPGGNVMPGGFE